MHLAALPADGLTPPCRWKAGRCPPARWKTPSRLLPLQALRTYGPLAITVWADGNKNFQLYKGGVYTPIYTTGTLAARGSNFILRAVGLHL